MPKKPLTVKEAKLVKGIAEGKPKYKAAIDAGYSPKTAPTIASQTLKKVNVQEALQVALQKHNITPDRTIQRVSEALDAEKVAIVGNGDQAMAEITPDHGTRLSAVKIANNLMGLGQKQDGGGDVHYHLHQAEQREKYDL